uniref:Pentatricopeptide repeat-containing protein n=1 Tax=Opuntia streptacantha TaxID=393608 RepID=A0A7C8YMI1_OPUST
MLPCPLSLPLKLIHPISNSNPKLFNFTHRFLSVHSSLPNHTGFPAPSSRFTPSPSSPINPNPSLQDNDFDTLCTLLKNPDLKTCRDLETALDETGIEPTSNLFRLMLNQLESSPKQAFFLVKWAEKRPGYDLPAPIFNSMLGVLARAGEFKWALMELMEKIKRGDRSSLVSAESFGILIRHYSRSELGQIMHTRVFPLVMEEN